MGDLVETVVPSLPLQLETGHVVGSHFGSLLGNRVLHAGVGTHLLSTADISLGTPHVIGSRGAHVIGSGGSHVIGSGGSHVIGGGGHIIGSGGAHIIDGGAPIIDGGAHVIGGGAHVIDGGAHVSGGVVHVPEIVDAGIVDGASYVFDAEHSAPVQVDEYHYEVEKVVPYNIPRNVTQVVTKAEPLVFERFSVVKKPVQVPVEI